MTVLCSVTGGKILLEYRDGFKVLNNVEGIEGIVTVSQYKKRLLFNGDEHVVLHKRNIAACHILGCPR